MEEVKVVKHEGDTYIDVNAFVGLVVRDLQKLPADAVVTRDEVIFALLRYAEEATNAMEA